MYCENCFEENLDFWVTDEMGSCFCCEECKIAFQENYESMIKDKKLAKECRDFAMELMQNIEEPESFICDRCEMKTGMDECVETIEGQFLCFGCDSARLEELERQ